MTALYHAARHRTGAHSFCNFRTRRSRNFERNHIATAAFVFGELVCELNEQEPVK